MENRLSSRFLFLSAQNRWNLVFIWSSSQMATRSSSKVRGRKWHHLHGCLLPKDPVWSAFIFFVSEDKRPISSHWWIHHEWPECCINSWGPASYKRHKYKLEAQVFSYWLLQSRNTSIRNCVHNIRCLSLQIRLTQQWIAQEEYYHQQRK